MGTSKGLRRRVGAAVLGACSALVAAAPASAANLGVEEVAVIGGAYAADCSDPAGLRLMIGNSGIAAEKEGRRIVGRFPTVSMTLADQPELGFQAVVRSRTDDGREIAFLVFRDRISRYLTLHADRSLLATIGANESGAVRYRDCRAHRLAGPEAQRERAAERQRARGATRHSALNDPRFRMAYARALGAKATLRWLAQLQGAASEPRKISIAGREYLRLAACNPNDCQNSNAVVLYSAVTGTAYVKVIESGWMPTLLGNPPPAIAAELDRAWRAEWRPVR